MLLVLKSIRKSFASPDDSHPVTVLDGIDVEIETGDTVGIVGPSGSGKSTLLNIIGGLDRPSSGNVLYDGCDIASFDDNRMAQFRNREIGFVFQLHHLLPQCSVIENVLLPTLAEGRASRGDRSQWESRARELIAKVGLSHRLTYRPGQLSGGERQRTAVARALMNRPRMLLADEPTGSLDRGHSEKLSELLIELNRSEKVTLIVVTHALGLADRMNRTYELSGGRLNPSGVSTPE